ncbi:hypothetical protein EYF80_018329 [Liparis tanakae]|uniref:Uncharacterized protein n=1 Tax=Liparis tanakae TaxID=230148 RepID=A0A4Z2I200_9TELE|nr:hypothetical protein EYF80_018329 [Liparis tanakae]
MVMMMMRAKMKARMMGSVSSRRSRWSDTPPLLPPARSICTPGGERRTCTTTSTTGLKLVLLRVGSGDAHEERGGEERGDEERGSKERGGEAEHSLVYGSQRDCSKVIGSRGQPVL